jgi:O-antigen/teichoic acid export membrane protein
MKEASLKDKTAKGLLWGGLSNGMQQLLNLVFGIFLARLLSAADYGMVGMLSIFSLIAGALQESGFQAALVNLKEPAHRDYNAVFWFSTGVSACLYALLFACAPLIADFYHTPALTSLARYAFLSIFAASFNIVPSAYLARHLMVKQRTWAITVGMLVSGTVGVTMAYLGFAYWGIATQTLVYIVTVGVGYWYAIPWRPTRHIDLSPLRGMIGFSSKLLITNIFTHLNNNLLTLILGKCYTEREVGFFTQANKWNQMGHMTVTGMVNSVAQPVLAGLREERERQLRAFRKMLRFTAFVSFPAMFGLSLIAPELITIAITDKWLPSALIMRILCVGGAFIPLAGLYSNLLISLGKSNLHMACTIALGLLQVGLMVSLYPYGMHTMIGWYVALNIAWLLVWHHFVQRQIGLTLWMAMRDLLPFAGLAAVAMAAAWWAASPMTNVYAVAIAKMLVAAGVYIGLLWASGSVTAREAVAYLRQRNRKTI